MAKKILELKQFLKGIVAAPSDADIPEDSPVFSKNIDPISEEGKLKAVPEDLLITDEEQRTANIRFWPTSNTGVNATPVISSYVYKLYLNGEKLSEFTGSAQAGATFKTTFSAYQATKYILDNTTWPASVESKEPSIEIRSTDDADGYGATLGTIASGITDTATEIQTSIPSPLQYYVGQSVTFDDGTNQETVTITNEDQPNSKIYVTRASTSYSFAMNDAIKAPVDYNYADIIFNENIQSLRFVIINAQGNMVSNVESEELTDSLEINPISTYVQTGRDQEAEKTHTDIILYDKDVDTGDTQIKVIENFYSENGSSRSVLTGDVVDSDDSSENQWALPNYDRVALHSGAGSVYIGTGGSSHSEPKWFGKILHKPFNQEIEGRFLVNSRLKPVDEDNTVFNISFTQNPVTAASWNSGVTPQPLKRDHENVIGISEVDRNFFWVKHKLLGSETETIVGKQTRSTTIGFIPGAMCSSQHLMKHFAEKGRANYLPYVNGDWTADNTDYTDYETSIASHLDNDVPGTNKSVKQTYAWVAGKDSYDTIKIMALRYIDDGADSRKLLVNEQMSYFKLDFKLETTAEMNTMLGAGKSIKRKPPISARISDIYEKDNTLFVLYCRDEGFTHNEEWLYAIDLTSISTTEHLSGDLVTAKPVTPAYRSLKKFNKDYRNQGSDWYAPSDVFDGRKVSDRYKVGKDGFYSVYSNRIKWRATDCLGFLTNGKHCSETLEVDSEILEPNLDNYWNTVWCEDDGDHNSYYWGWQDRSTESSNDYDDDHPRLPSWLDYKELEGFVGNNMNIGKTYGFKEGTYRIYPHKKGLTNYRDDSDEIGVVAYLEGEQLLSDIVMKSGYKKLTQGVKKWHKYNWFENTVTPEFKSWDQWVIMPANKHNYGALQRSMGEGGHTTRMADQVINDGEGGSSTVYYIQKIDNEFIDGVYSSNWSAVNLLHNENTASNLIDGRIIRMKCTFRPGSIFNQNTATNTLPTNSWEKASHRAITPLQVSTAGSSQPNNDLITQPPPSKYGLVSVSRGDVFTNGADEYLTNTNNDKTNKRMYMSGVMPGLTHNDTAIAKWTANTTTFQGNKIDANKSVTSELNADSTFGPLKLSEIGTSSMSLSSDGTYEIAKVFATTGSIKSGFAKYSSDGTVVDPGESDPYHTSNTPYLHLNPSGDLDVGLSFLPQSLTDIETVTDDDGNSVSQYKTGNFNEGQTYYYKVAVVYDSFQEGPLSFNQYARTVTETGNYKNMQIILKLSSPPIRASHITIYRRNSEDEFFRLVAEQPLEDDAWTYNSSDNVYTAYVNDNGTLGANYEAITGMPEDLEYTLVHYGIATEASGHLVVADCWHPEVKQSKNFIFKSQPQAYSTFNWAKDFCVLPNKPTAIQWFAGKIYAFDLHNTWRVNLDSMVVEDAFEGTGCIGQESILVTDFGMFFADYQGIYFHNGNMSENISRDISHNSAADTLDSLDTNTDYNYEWSPWQNISHKLDPHLLYNPKDQSVLVCFINEKEGSSDISAAWKYSITRKRWDFLELDEFTAVITGTRNDIYLGGKNKLLQIGASTNLNKAYDWVSKSFNMGSLSEDKVINGLKFQMNTAADATSFKNALNDESDLANVVVWMDETKKAITTDYTVKTKKNSVTLKFKGNKSFKKFRFEIHNCIYEIDSISLIYRNKNVKV